jgi:hypothetical protein
MWIFCWDQGSSLRTGRECLGAASMRATCPADRLVTCRTRAMLKFSTA